LILNLTDNAAVARVLDGDTLAFSELVERHGRRVFRTCLRVVRNPDDAQDCTQTSLATAFEKLHQFRSDAPFGAWLNRIAIHTALTTLRRQRPESAEVPSSTGDDRQPSFEPSDVRPNPEAACYRSEITTLVRREVDALPASLRAAMVLRHVHDLNTEDAARALGVSTQAVRSRLFRAHRRIERRLVRALGKHAATLGI
jgi:RNA polymerase sigma-70 factor (ECF subfamily)